MQAYNSTIKVTLNYFNRHNIELHLKCFTKRNQREIRNFSYIYI